MNLFSYLTLTLIELNIIIKMNPLNQVEEFPSRRAARRAATSWRHALACVLCACLSGLFGCTRQPPTQPATPTSEASRIICGSPAIAEIVFSLGCGDRVVGVSAFTDWPPVAAQKPIIGDALTPNREKLLALQPDLILAQGRAESLRRFAAAQHIPFVTLPLETLADLRAMIHVLAETLGVPQQGQRILEKMDADLRAFTAPAQIPVFIALDHSPGDLSGLMTAGPNTFLSEIVEKAGGNNIFSDISSSWPRISQETLIRRKPALILDLQSTPANDTRRAALLADWEKLGFQPHQIRILDDGTLLKPGLRAIYSARQIATALHAD